MQSRNTIEKIFYGILVILCLEHVRVRFNKIVKEGKENKKTETEIKLEQKRHIRNTSLVYAIVATFFFIKLWVGTVGEIIIVYEGLDYLSSSACFYIVLIGGYLGSVLILKAALRKYIETLNHAKNFFSIIGRNIWDGSISVVGNVAGAASGVGNKAVGRIREHFKKKPEGEETL